MKKKKAKRGKFGKKHLVDGVVEVFTKFKINYYFYYYY